MFKGKQFSITSLLQEDLSKMENRSFIKNKTNQRSASLGPALFQGRGMPWNQVRKWPCFRGAYILTGKDRQYV